jgi:pimeloyl-ACP methyl ester carboxylesterase
VILELVDIELPDGRLLEIEVSGPEDGVPLLFHHGTPGSARPFGQIERAAHARGLRLVTYSRPGYGTSTRQPGRGVADVVQDMRAVLDHLGTAECLVAGWSGGGPRALATAARLPDRVRGVLVIAGIAPFNAEGLDYFAGMGESNVEGLGYAARGDEATLRERATRQVAARDAGTPEALIASMRSLLPEVDKAVLTDEFARDMLANFGHGTSVSVDGWVDDNLAACRDWGFTLDELTVPTFLWQGELDLMVPFGHGRWLAEHLPGVVAHLEPGEGHLSIAVGKLDAMLAELTSVLKQPAE